MATLIVYLLITVILFCIGLYGLASKRNIMRLFFSIEILTNAANLSLIALARFLPLPSVIGQTIVLFTIAMAAAEAVVGLAIVILVSRVHNSVDVRELRKLEG